MKKLKVAALVILATILIVVAAPQLRVAVIEALSFSKCDKPEQYKLGTLDERFGLSQVAALADIKNAADIWSKSYGKQLFTNDPGADITVNFIYDERSALNAKISKTEGQLSQNDLALNQKIRAYEADVTSFEKKLASFNALVEQINRSGGASPDQYDALSLQQKELQAEGDGLNARAKQLSLATRNYNSQVKNLNQNINQFNEALTQKPEEGVFDARDNTITIYFTGNHQELIHTLAHEFGHALGMQHTNDSKSIMYPKTSWTLMVTSQDKQQLENVCKEKLFLLHWLGDIALWLRATSHP